MRARGQPVLGRGRGLALGGLIVAALVAGAAGPATANESGLRPQVISLPSGPGSIEGLGPSFEPQLNTGAASYTVPFDVPPGVAGLQPDLAITYNGGSGNGVFGLGWELGLPAVERQTDKGQPSYGADDVFVFGGEELVALAESPVSWRCENESGFRRFRRVGEGWEVTEPSGRKLVFGHAAGDPRPVRVGRQADGAGWVAAQNPAFDATFRWYLASVEDPNGNRIEYHYASFPDSPGRLYLASARYADDGMGSYNEVTLAYESTERPDAWSDWRSGFEIRTSRLPRLLRTWSLGALAHEYRFAYDEDPAEVLDPLGEGARPLRVSLLTSVTQHDRIPGDATVYLPPLRFGYTRLHLADVNNAPASFPGPEDVDLDGDGAVDPLGAVSAEVANVPYLDFSNGNSDLFDVNGDGLPDLFETTTQGHYWYRNLGDGEIDPARREIARNPSLGAVPLGETATRLADADGDGRADLVRILGGSGSRWVDVHQIEIAADGSAQWVFTGRDEGIPQVMPGFGTPGAQVFDVDFDKVIDVVQMGTSVQPGQGTLWTSCTREPEGDANFAPFSVYPGPEDVDEDGDGVRDSHPWSCAAGGTLNLPSWIPVSSYDFADMNGDRIQDVVVDATTGVSGTRYLSYWPGMGGARFAPEVALWTEAEDGQASRDFVVGSSVTDQNLRLADVTGDGRADLVRVQSGLLYLWINLGGDRFTTRIELAGAPIWTGAAPQVRFADFDGNGSTDLVLSKPGWLHWVDFAPLVRPNLLRIVDNGIGLRTTIHYTSSTQLYADAGGPRGAGEDGFANPWSQTTPFPMQVVSRVETSSGLDLDAAPGAETYAIDYLYRDPYYDPVEHEFRGFAFVKKIEVGDATAPTRVTRTFFHTGAPDGVDNDGDGLTDERSVRGGAEDEPLKGRILVAEVTREPPGGETSEGDGQPAPDDRLFSRQSESWRIRRIHAPAPGGGSRGIPTVDEREVSFAFSEQTLTDVVELGVEPAHVLETRREYDDFGNETRLEERGSLSIAGDERATVRQFVHETDAWIVNRPFRQVLEDGQGGRVTESLTYYDGSPFTGLPLGTLTAGNVTRESAWVGNDGSGDTYVDTARYERDGYGNVVATLDPLGTPTGDAHRFETAWHAQLHNLPVQELHFVGGGKAPLQVDADYDTGLGVVTRFEDFTGVATTYVHDGFGRLVKRVRPGDTLAQPTETYLYRLADPRRFQVYAYDTALGMQLLEGQPATPSSVVTETREVSGQSGVFTVVAYTDGLGRPLGTWTEGEAGEWIVSDAQHFNARAGVAAVFQPHAAPDPGFSAPLQGARTDVSYDATGRETRRLQPPDHDGARGEIVYAFDPLSRTVTDEEANVRVRVEDGLGRVVEDHEHEGAQVHVTRYAYNAADNLVRVTDARQNVRHLGYDGLQRRVFLDDPDRGQMSWFHDAASNVESTLDAKGQRIRYGYDGVNRLLWEDYEDEGEAFSAELAPDVTYVYDALAAAVPQGDGSHAPVTFGEGRLVAVLDPSGEEYTSYDARGNVDWTVKRIRDPRSGAFATYRTGYEYDAMDRIRRLHYPDGDSVEYTYNGRSLIETVVGGPSGYLIEDTAYAPSGKVEDVSFGNGVLTDYGYDPRLRLTDIHASAPGAPPVADLEYRFDLASNIERIVDHRSAAAVPAGDPRRNHQHFDYDDLYRLDSVRYSYAPGDIDQVDARVDYDYDAIGNMQFKTSDLALEERGMPVASLGVFEYGGGPGGASGRDGRGFGEPPGPHALTKITAPDGSVRPIGYDGNGNVESLDGATLVWDYKNRLVSVIRSDLRADYGYDYRDRRTTKTVTKAAEGEEPPPPAVLTQYVSRNYEVRDHGEHVKYVFYGSTRLARVSGPLDDGTTRIQRVGLSTGWNLVSVQLDAGSGLPDVPEVEAAYRWNAGSETFASVAPGQALAAGEVLWLRASAATQVEIVGTRVAPTPPGVVAGDQFVAVPGPAPLAVDEDLPAELERMWFFDAAAQRWRLRATGPLAATSDAPAAVAPGSAFFASATGPAQLEAAQPPEQVRYYHQDHLGSSNAVTDESGALVEEVAFLPFGHPRHRHAPPGRETGTTRYLFGQKELDAETGYSYFEARYLASPLGRFLSVDPVLTRPAVPEDPQELNAYAFAGNNPLTYSDRTGEIVESVLDAASLAAGVHAISQWDENTSWWTKAMDVGGVVVDAAALAVPGVPGGASLGVRALREGGEQVARHADEAASVANRLRERARRALSDCSFAPDTPVATPDGPVPIESIGAGDLVLSADESGARRWAEVESRFGSLHERGLEVWVRGADGSGEVVLTTDEHPFWVEGLGWTPAARLAPGDDLVDADGGLLAVEALVPTDAPLYAVNLDVAAPDTFFVGESAAWVHNACPTGRNTKPRGAQNPEVRAAAERGREAHRRYRDAVGGRADVEVTLPSGRRADAVEWDTRTVRELKPDNPRAVRRGERQVEAYRRELEDMTGESWTGVVDTYKP